MTFSDKTIRYLSLLGARGVLGEAVYNLALEKTDFYAVSADLGITSGFRRLMDDFPEKFVNVGIAEQNMIAIASALSDSGIPVIASTWAAFATYRCADQLRCYLGHMRRNVKVVGFGAGLDASYFGESHYGYGDIGVIRSIPGITVLTPSDGVEIYAAISEAVKREGPYYIRINGGDRLPIIHKNNQFTLSFESPEVMAEGNDVMIMSHGAALEHSIKAAEVLNNDGISTGIINCSLIQTEQMQVLKNYRHVKLIVIVEEHSITGGLGTIVAEYLSSEKNHPVILRLGLEKTDGTSGSREYVLSYYGLSADRIIDRIKARLLDL